MHKQIKVEPKTLKFLYACAPSERKAVLEVRNDGTSRWVAFKMKTNSPKVHLIAPQIGYIPPRHKAVISVVIKPNSNGGRKMRQKVLVMLSQLHTEEGTLSGPTRSPKMFWRDQTRRYEWEEVIVACEWVGDPRDFRSSPSLRPVRE